MERGELHTGDGTGTDRGGGDELEAGQWCNRVHTFYILLLVALGGTQVDGGYIRGAALKMEIL